MHIFDKIVLTVNIKAICFFHQKGDKVNKYSLNDNEEELTHYGQSLSEIEKFDNPDISDEDDEDQGRIDGMILCSGKGGGLRYHLEVKAELMKWYKDIRMMITGPFCVM